MELPSDNLFYADKTLLYNEVEDFVIEPAPLERHLNYAPLLVRSSIIPASEMKGELWILTPM